MLVRLAIVVAILPHAVAKFVLFNEFTDKFDLPTVIAILADSAEFLGVLGIVGGGLFRKWWLTALGALGIAVVQVGAIATVHWPVWFYYRYGMEYNVVILLLCAAAVASHRYTGREEVRQ